jgi:hypothetical protein
VSTLDRRDGPDEASLRQLPGTFVSRCARSAGRPERALGDFRPSCQEDLDRLLAQARREAQS